MTGTFVNVATVLAGTLVGALLGARLPGGMQQRVLMGLGLITLLLGIDYGLAWRETNPLFVLAAVLLGGLAGEALAIERRLEAVGNRIQTRLAGRPQSRVSEAFVTASLLFCVGPLTVVGSIQDGLRGDSEALLTKATLDGFASIALASTLGWGVALAAGSVLVIQGGIALGAGLFAEVLVGEPLAALTSAGGLLIVGIALKLLGVRDVKVGNFLPALVIAPALAALL